jgi:hypothetical protein
MKLPPHLHFHPSAQLCELSAARGDKEHDLSALWFAEHVRRSGRKEDVASGGGKRAAEGVGPEEGRRQ